MPYFYYGFMQICSSLSLSLYLSLSLSLSPSLPPSLQHSATIEAANAKAREKERTPLLNVYPELIVHAINFTLKHSTLCQLLFLSLFLQQTSPKQSDSKPPAPVPEERLGYRFMVKCNHLEFKLTTERNGEKGNVRIYIIYTVYIACILQILAWLLVRLKQSVHTLFAIAGNGVCTSCCSMKHTIISYISQWCGQCMHTLYKHLQTYTCIPKMRIFQPSSVFIDSFSALCAPIQ